MMDDANAEITVLRQNMFVDMSNIVKAEDVLLEEEEDIDDDDADEMWISYCMIKKMIF